MVGNSLGSLRRCSRNRTATSDSPCTAPSVIACMNSSNTAPKAPTSGRSATATDRKPPRATLARAEAEPGGGRLRRASRGYGGAHGLLRATGWGSGVLTRSCSLLVCRPSSREVAAPALDRSPTGSRSPTGALSSGRLSAGEEDRRSRSRAVRSRVWAIWIRRCGSPADRSRVQLADGGLSMN